MNIFSLLGFIIATGVFVVGLRLATDNILMFVDFSSAFIVLGGTFAATAISFQLNSIGNLFKIFLTHLMGSQKVSYAKNIEELLKVGETYRKGNSLDEHINGTKDHFFKEALEIVNDGFLAKEEVIGVLEDRAANMYYQRAGDAGKIKTLAQFPPAFGMMGTTIGMIVLLANLGAADAIKKIGPAMGVCLITTLYGVAIANLVVIPVAENLTEHTKNVNLANTITVEGIKLILEKTNPIVMAEKLNSFLLPKERLDWKEVLNG